MNDPNFFHPSVKLFNKQLRKEHELYLLKYALLNHNDQTQALGPLDKPPLKEPVIPNFVIRERITGTGDSYVIARGDLQGETKVNKFGKLLGNRHFLFSTFTPPTRPHSVFVLVRDLLECLSLSVSPEQFLQESQQLYGVKASPDELVFLRENKLLAESALSENEYYVTTKSVYMLYGARVLVGGTRLVDDYWEEAVKEQGFLPHYRVFVIDNKILRVMNALKTDTPVQEPKSDEAALQLPDEPPYLTIAEQTSWEVKQDYLKRLGRGEHLNVIIPGQNITGSLELSAQSKLPKYHSKISLQAAIQMGIEDTPIGTLPQPQSNIPTTSIETSSKSDKRLLSGIIDPLVISKVDRSGVTQWTTSGIVAQDVSLNINGWKFDSLPVKSMKTADLNYSVKGLPLYDSTKLAERLKMLTPNEINEMQHLHDSVYVDTKLQSARKVRKTKWTKYWQHKAGLPIGITKNDTGSVLEKYLSDVANHVDVVSTINGTLNKEEIKTFKRIPNANFKGYSNITGLKPPYVNE
ncbi:LANO_0D10946g1_1 [Lachancea nothofagi CBS 11611]|uniref:LANO_0D10946g1_1 n=1 Tax=Lachancea nothofagi CBS 11611 TaxID=1266666 RepID=A0A1G4JLA7_9SACH|nr:LANO_0D10946g1_1 [Lachancea nothofagi CBS 11611]